MAGSLRIGGRLDSGRTAISPRTKRFMVSQGLQEEPCPLFVVVNVVGIKKTGVCQGLLFRCGSCFGG